MDGSEHDSCGDWQELSYVASIRELTLTDGRCLQQEAVQVASEASAHKGRSQLALQSH